MSTETKPTFEKGLCVARFKSEIAAVKKGEAVIKPAFVYERDRIVMPYNKAGKDINDKEVNGAVPSMSDVLNFLQEKGIKAEIEYNGVDRPEMSVCELLVIGANAHFNSEAKDAADNSEETMIQRAITARMKLKKETREVAEPKVRAAFA